MGSGTPALSDVGPILASVPAPQYLFHAAPECTFDAINAHGLARATVYASGSPEHALRFVVLNAFHHLHGITSRTLPDGSTAVVPDLAVHDIVYVWQIDTDMAERTWTHSTDHSPEFFGESTTSWVSDGPVPRDALLDFSIYTRDQLEAT